MTIDNPRPAYAPAMRSSHSRISQGALWVNAGARTECGGTPCSRSRAIRRVTTVVFPEPGPAITSWAPLRCRTARSWASVSPFNNADSMLMRGSYRSHGQTPQKPEKQQRPRAE